MQRIFIGLHDQLKDSDTRFYIITDSVFGASYALIHIASRPRLPDLTSESMNGRVQMRLGDLTRWSIVHQENQRFFKMSGFAACHLNGVCVCVCVCVCMCVHLALHFLINFPFFSDLASVPIWFLGSTAVSIFQYNATSTAWTTYTIG